MATRSRRASARRAVLAHLREIKRVTANLASWWDVPTTVYVPLAERESSDRNAMLRDRRQDEYPEAQAYYWASTVAKVDVMMAELDALRAFAVTEYYKCEKGN